MKFIKDWILNNKDLFAITVVASFVIAYIYQYRNRNIEENISFCILMVFISFSLDYFLGKDKRLSFLFVIMQVVFYWLLVWIR